MKSPSTLLSEAWSIYTGRIGTFIGITAIPLVAIAVFGIGGGLLAVGTAGEQLGLIFLVLLPIVFLAFLVIALMVTIATIKLASSEEMTIAESLSFASSKIFSYLWIMILTSLVVLLGFLLLIVPGIIFSVWFMFGYIVLVFEDKRGIAALKQSKEYVRGRWWKVFWRLLFFGLIAILISIVFFIGSMVGTAIFGDIVGQLVSMAGNFIIQPLALIYTYCMYLDLLRLRLDEAEVVDTPEHDASTSPEAVSAPTQAAQSEQTQTPGQTNTPGQ